MKYYLNGDDWKCKAYLGEDWIWRNGEKRETQDVRWWKPGLVRAGEKNLVSVVLNKAPDEQSQVSKTRYVKTHKSRMTYWWDFCPRMIHMGIWDDVYLDITGPARIGQADLEGSPEIRISAFNAEEIFAETEE